MPPIALACLTYLGVALPGSTLGLLWPSMRLSFGEPVGALGFLLLSGVAASVIASAASTGRILSACAWVRSSLSPSWCRPWPQAAEAVAPSLWVFAAGVVLFGLGFGVVDSALNAYAAGQFGARDINWMHASYGLGATIGPLAMTALMSGGITWRWAYGMFVVGQVPPACVLTAARRSRPTDQACSPLSSPGSGRQPASGPDAAEHRKPQPALVLTALAFTATETGIESGAGIWGYIFLTAGRGLPHQAAGIAVSAYWATMFAGRALLVLGLAMGGVYLFLSRLAGRSSIR